MICDFSHCFLCFSKLIGDTVPVEIMELRQHFPKKQLYPSFLLLYNCQYLKINTLNSLTTKHIETIFKNKTPYQLISIFCKLITSTNYDECL